MNKGEAIRKLKYKMKLKCDECYAPEYIKDWCKDCPIHVFTNLMIMELGD